MSGIQPFESSIFLRDEFFRQDSNRASGYATIARVVDQQSATPTKTVQCTIKHGLDPERKGALMARAGLWAEIAILVFDWENLYGVGTQPAQNDAITVDGDEFITDSYDPSGDMFLIYGLARQRKQR